MIFFRRRRRRATWISDDMARAFETGGVTEIRFRDEVSARSGAADVSNWLRLSGTDAVCVVPERPSCVESAAFSERATIIICSFLNLSDLARQAGVCLVPARVFVREDAT